MATFHIQPNGSHVNWTGKKVLGLHTGSIKLAGGSIELHNNNIATGEVIMDMTSIVITDIEDQKTHDDFLAHLHHDDFFAVEQFKTARLEVNTSVPLANNQFRISGNLTIKNITHPVTFLATVEVFTDFLHAMGEITIDRTLYNIRYGSGKFFANLGNTLIFDEFVLQFKLIAQQTN